MFFYVSPKLLRLYHPDKAGKCKYKKSLYSYLAKIYHEIFKICMILDEIYSPKLCVTISNKILKIIEDLAIRNSNISFPLFIYILSTWKKMNKVKKNKMFYRFSQINLHDFCSSLINFTLQKVLFWLSKPKSTTNSSINLLPFNNWWYLWSPRPNFAENANLVISYWKGKLLKLYSTTCERKEFSQ